MPSLELLDVIQHAKPNILNIDPLETSKSLRKAKGSNKNYNMALDQIQAYCSGLQKLPDLLKFLRTHPNQEWHKYLEDVGTRLLDIFGNKPSVWYPTGRKPIESAGGLLIKPAIRGVWVSESRVLPCVINARSSVLLDSQCNLPFVARGVYELHVRDLLGATGSMVIDLGKDARTGLRANCIYFPTEAEMMSLEQFESISRKFDEALILAGLKSQAAASSIDLFRARKDN